MIVKEQIWKIWTNLLRIEFNIFFEVSAANYGFNLPGMKSVMLPREVLQFSKWTY